MVRSGTCAARALLAAATVIAAAACQQPAAPGGPFGTIAVVFELGNESKTTRGGGSTDLPFGDVPMGERQVREFRVQNLGDAPLFLEGFEPGSSLEGGAFTVPAAKHVQLLAGASLPFEATFLPPVDANSAVVAHQVAVTVRASGTAPGEETVQLVLGGRGISADCSLPPVVDFGAVTRGDTAVKSVTVANTRASASTAFAGDLQQPAADVAYAFTPDSPRQEFTVPSHESRVVQLRFAPREARTYEGTLPLQADLDCPGVSVRLLGTGVDQLLTWEPALLDLGYVPPGSSSERTAVFENAGFQPVTLTQLQPYEGASQATAFTVVEANPGDVTTLTVPPATRDAAGTLHPGVATVKVRFTSAALSPYQGVLRASANSPLQSAIAVPLRGVGGGPDIDVQPWPTLDLGRSAYFAGQPGVTSIRNLIIRNVGSVPNPPDPRANLHLGAGGTGAPYWTVTAKSANASASELCVGEFDEQTNTCLGTLPAQPPVYDPAVGLEAAPGRNTILVPVRLLPAGLGQKLWEVTIFSNDPDEPQVRVTITAEIISLPPCNYTVSPLSLDFGVLAATGPRDRPIRIRNNSTNAGDICLVSNVSLSPGTDSVFTLVGGPVFEKELQPGEVFDVMVRAELDRPLPPLQSVATGLLSFDVSSGTRPRVTAALRAELAPTCLVVAPNVKEFGTVRVGPLGCNFANRTLHLMNVCSQPVTLQTVTLLSAAGLPAFSAGCPGNTPCPEFSVVSTPTMPLALQPNTGPYPLVVEYAPLDTGDDVGLLAVGVQQSGVAMTYLVDLRGSGTTGSSKTDSFLVDANPKLDVLLMLDESCSMASWAGSLRSNLDSFFSFLSTRADFHVGVATAEYPGSGVLHASTRGTRVVTPGTPLAADELRELTTSSFMASSLESCLDPAVLALSTANLSNPSGSKGLLRPGTPLALLCVTDGSIQGVNPFAWYLDQFRNAVRSERPGMFTFSAIGWFPSSSCTTPPYDNGVSENAVNSTFGVMDSICEPTWSNSLRDLGNGLLVGPTRFFLTQTPDLTGSNTLDVLLNGVPVPQTQGASTVWSYEPAANAVVFNPLYSAAPGDTVTVGYTLSCN